MATYALGDVQGCFLTLERLMRRVAFDPDRDRLWLVGDLVNRGPRSLQVLRLARELDGRVTAVLGNHDLHLLAIAHGVRRARARDTLDAVLRARDRDELIQWLETRPLLHREGTRVLVHAGLLPGWSVGQAEALAREAEAALRRSPRRALGAFFRHEPRRWRDDLHGKGRLAVIAQGLTRLRTCKADGTMNLEFSGHPTSAPRGFLPWFLVPDRASADATVVFGHWAALGLHARPGLWGIDTGCAWGRDLTAVRLEDGALFHEPLADG